MDTSAKESVVFPMLNDTKMKICRGMSHIHCTCPNMLASFECCSIGTGVAQVLCPKTLCLTPNICFTRRTQCYTLCTYNRRLVQVVCPKHTLSQSIRECYVFVGNVLIDSRWIHITPFSRSISMEWLSQLSRFSCKWNDIPSRRGYTSSIPHNMFWILKVFKIQIVVFHL